VPSSKLLLLCFALERAVSSPSGKMLLVNSTMDFFGFSKSWYVVWSHDSRALQTLKVMRSNVKIMTLSDIHHKLN